MTISPKPKNMNPLSAGAVQYKAIKHSAEICFVYQESSMFCLSSINENTIKVKLYLNVHPNLNVQVKIESWFAW